MPWLQKCTNETWDSQFGRFPALGPEAPKTRGHGDSTLANIAHTAAAFKVIELSRTVHSLTLYTILF